MIQKLNFHGTVSSLSIGQVGFNVLRELYKRKVQCSIFLREFKLDAFKVEPQFEAWLRQGIEKRLTKLDRNVPTLALWHINQSEFKPSDKQYLFTFHETDSPTETEVNIVNQQEHTFFSSNWSVDNFKTFGAPNTSFVPLGLDEDFTVIPERQVPNDITHWLLCGKFEQRKNTELVIKTWLKKYRDKKEHQLTLCVTNPFFQPEQMTALYQNCFGGAKPFNVNVLDYVKTNAAMNRLYNSADIDLSGLSSSEGWGLPAFTATALGKWSCVTNCTAHKDWATKENSILVEVDAMRTVYDGVFFGQGQPFSQGNVYSISEEQVSAAMDEAQKRAKTPNPEGLKLATQFTYKRTVDEILAKISQ
jgi:hypothetical protein